MYIHRSSSLYFPKIIYIRKNTLSSQVRNQVSQKGLETRVNLKIAYKIRDDTK